MTLRSRREASRVQFLDFNVEELRARLRKMTRSIPAMQRAGRGAVGTFSLPILYMAVVLPLLTC
jgi:hypothetical protein